MRDPLANTRTTTTKKDGRAVEAAIKEAEQHLRPLTKNPAPSMVNWNDPSANRHPKAEFYAAVGFLDCILNPDPDRHSDARQAADNFLRGRARIVREDILPALRRGLPPKGPNRNRPSLLLRDRWIAAAVDDICSRHGFNPTRNNATERPCGCSLVAAAAKRLKLHRLSESHVATIWKRARER